MNNKELQALRKLLMLDVSEAAEHIGDVSNRSWQFWEAGRSAVPKDVADLMEDYVNLRDSLLRSRINEFEKTGKRIKLNYYISIDEFEQATGKRNVVMWRITNSVAAELYAERMAELV